MIESRVYPTREIPEEIKDFVKKELEADFDWINFQDFRQDIFGYEVDGEVYPPTLNWKATISVRRKKDGAYIYCVVPEYDDYWTIEHSLIEILKEDFSNAIDTLMTFAKCECVNIEGKQITTCDYHKTWLGEEEKIDGNRNSTERQSFGT